MFSPAVVIRPALPSDAHDVLEFTKFIWEGHDYIKYVWDDWLADPQGFMVVAQYGPHAVGLGKLTLISPGQWWLEGLRVDPQHQGLKIGSHIFEYLDDWWKQHGSGTVRLMTSSERVQVHHLSDRLGYARIGEVRSYQARALDGPAEMFKPARSAEVPEAAEFAHAQLAALNGLMDWGWKFSTPDEGTLEQKVKEQRLFWWQGKSRRGLLASWEDEDDGEKLLGIAFAAAAAENLPDMLVDIRRLAGSLGLARVQWLAPVLKPVESALKAARYATDWEQTGVLYEKRQPG